MELKEILTKCDHTLLSPTATWDDIQTLCDEGLKYGTASVCIPAAYVKKAHEYVCGRLPICTVVGFPNGYSTTAAKCFEAREAIENGASEIDMVVNLGWVKEGHFDQLRDEIEAVKIVCGSKILKVIIETCLLTDEEKRIMCRVVNYSGADYIKTSTGFSTGGATFEDIELFRENLAPYVKIKAAGGISSLEDAEKFIALGASRLGTSRIIKLAKGQNSGSSY